MKYELRESESIVRIDLLYLTSSTHLLLWKIHLEFNQGINELKYTSSCIMKLPIIYKMQAKIMIRRKPQHSFFYRTRDLHFKQNINRSMRNIYSHTRYCSKFLSKDAQFRLNIKPNIKLNTEHSWYEVHKVSLYSEKEDMTRYQGRIHESLNFAQKSV